MSEVLVNQDYSLVVRDLEKYVTLFEEQFPLEDFAKGEFKQHPAVTLLTCSDARMPVTVFGPIFNRIFSVENIGNQVKTSAGSVLYGLLHLHTPVMIVAGHTDCGAINSANSNFVDEPMAIRNELSIVKNSLEDILYKTGFVPDEDSGLKFSQLAELNVDMQVEYLLAHRAVANLVEKKHLIILGIMEDLHNVHGNGHAKLYTVNVNGEVDPEVIKSYSNLGFIADRARRLTQVR
ncbi:MAG: carbonic anhydrase [Syntrophomonadaceae bacterium]|nr:carbonic anhydrase [Syntrophomonadaceae bacterium]